jgi:hypothetical protein
MIHAAHRATAAFTLVLMAAAVMCACSTHTKEGRMPTTEKGSFAGLALTPPAAFSLKDDTTEKVRSPIPGAPPTVERFRSYQDRAGHAIYLFSWDGLPRDRGPMAVAEQWKTTVGGEPATVSLTSMFFGRQQQVLVTHVVGPAPARNRYMIYTTLLDRPAFAAMLASARFVDRR